MTRLVMAMVFLVAAALAAPEAARAAITQVAAGSEHTVALMDDGTVMTWGSNWAGQLGDGTTTSRNIPTPVPGLTGVRAIAAGGIHTMALMSDGTVRAWGVINYYHDMPDGETTPDSLTPVAIPGLAGVAAIAAGIDHNLALMHDGTVRAWGNNYEGQLGNGTWGNSDITLTPIPVPELTGVAAIAAGCRYTVALMNDGTVSAWGDNSHGQLGNGTWAGNRSTPTPVPGLTGVRAIAAGYMHTVALMADGTVSAWGYNGFGQLGNGTTLAGGIRIPTSVPGLTGVRAIAAGYNHSVALMDDGTAMAWGRNDFGQLGDGTMSNPCVAPTAIPELTGVANIAAGENHTVAFMADNSVRTWGNNWEGQLGNGTWRDNRFSPTAIPGITAVRAIAGGDNHTVALMSDGTVWVWGDNSDSQLGDGTTSNRLTPIPVSDLTGVTAIAAGIDQSMALMADGTVRAWGKTVQGELLTPTPVPGLTGVAAIAIGGSHTMALMTDGTVRVWGDNSYGQLGDGTTIDRLTPTPVPGLTGVIAIAAGASFSLALMADGTVMAWGIDDYGQLGDGIWNNNHATPTPVYDLTGVAAIAAGYAHAVALKNDGTVMAWGANGSGQLGNGISQVYVPSPKPVDGLTGVAAITAGDNYTVALMADGTVRAWGNNSYGQLGDGTWESNRLIPTAVPRLTGVAAIAAGSAHTLALKTDGTVNAWGDNNQGQLGIGYDSLTPHPIVFSLHLPISGNGGGGVTAATAATTTSWNEPDGLDNFPMLTAVTLTPHPDSCSEFLGWSGACVGTAPCTLIMDNHQTVAATFRMIDSLTTTFYRDRDGDGTGDPGDPLQVCTGTTPAGYVANTVDCNDANPAINPTAVEVCGDAIDNNCNGVIDAADPGGCGRYAYFFPAIKDDDEIGWENYLTVAAKDPVPMDVTIKVYDMWTGLLGQFVYSNTDPAAKASAIAPYARVSQRPSWIAGSAPLPVPVQGSVIVETSVPAIASINNIANFYKGFSIYESAKPRQVHNFPKAFDGPDNFQVYMLVQNIHDQEINVSVKLFAKTPAEPGNGAVKSYILPPFATLKIRPSWVVPPDPVTGLAINFSGSVVVTSDLASPTDALGLPVPAMCRYEAGQEALGIYESTVPQPALSFPNIKDGKFGGALDYQNFLSVVNPDSTTKANVNVMLYDNAGNLKGQTGLVAIAPGGKITWRPKWITGTMALPVDFEGSIIVTTDIPVVGQTNTIYPGNNQYGTDGFDLFESSIPTPSLFFPKVYDNLPGSGVGAMHLIDNVVYVQNPAASARVVIIEQYNNNGTMNGTRTLTLAAHATHVYRPKDLVTDASGIFRGSVKVTEQSGQPITGAIKYEVHKTIATTSVIEAISIYRSMGQ